MMRARTFVLGTAVATGIALLMGGASASIATFTDRAAWTLASGGVTGSEDFEGFATDTSFNGAVIALSSGMSIGTIVADTSLGSSTNKVDMPPAEASHSDVNGTTHARVFNGQTGEPTTPFIVFASAIKAFGADFANINDDEALSEIELYSGATLIATIAPSIQPSDTVRFFGFVADAGEQITEMRFVRIRNDIFGIDNISIAAAAPAVPAPATILLLGAGLAGLALRRRA